MAEQQLPQAQIQATEARSPVIESHLVAVLAYLSTPLCPYLIFVPMVPLLWPRMKRSAYMRYHGWNALLLTLLVGAVRGLLNVAALPVALAGGAWSDIWCAVLSLLSYVAVPTVSFLLAGYLAHEAYRRRPAQLPLLSHWAHRWAGDLNPAEGAAGDERPQAEMVPRE